MTLLLQEPFVVVSLSEVNMGQEFFVNSETLEAKVRSLLPSQGGAGAGVDLSASTQIVPIIDLTESAEGSNFRQDLQKALSFKSITAFTVENTTTTIVNNTGYYRVYGEISTLVTSGTKQIQFLINDGATDKSFKSFVFWGSSVSQVIVNTFDVIIYLNAGDSFKIQSTATECAAVGCTRQIATIDGELVNPN